MEVITERRLALLEAPEFRAAVEALRTSLDAFHDEYAPVLDRCRSLPDQATLIEISDVESMRFADDWAREQVLASKREAEAVVRPWADFGHLFHKTFVTLLKLGTDPCGAALDTINRKTIEYHNRIEAARQEAERKARLERERIERERKAEEERLRAAAEKEAAAQRAAMEAAAVAAAAAGDTEAAQAIREEAATVEAEPVALALAPEPTPLPLFSMPQPAAVKGLAIAGNWKARLVEPDGFERLILWVAKDVRARKHLLALDQTAANREAKNHEAELVSIIPGLEAWNDQGVRRGKR